MKKRIIGITIIVIAIVICGITYFKHQENVKQENITKQVNELENIKTNFLNTEERDEKFDILKSTVQKQEKYDKSKEKDSKVLAKYKEIILDMQLEFVDEYNKIIKENTISDIGKSEDIENLNKCKDNLNTLLSNINKEKEFIFSEESGAEKYEKRIPIARENFRRAGRENQITLLEGDAADILKELQESYDLIFMDAAKGQYIHFMPEVMRLLAPGGILVSDNVLQDGDIFESRYGIKRRNHTIHNRMREYLYALTHDEALDTVILETGDGMAISVKKE